MIKKSTLREIKNSLTRYLAIFAIVALGVGFYSGLQMSKPDMVDTGREYVDEHNLYDYEILSSYGIDEDSIKEAKATEGVADAEGSIQHDIIVNSDNDAESVFKAISMPEKITTLNLVKGRATKNPNECLIDSHLLLDSGFDIGDTITISKTNSKENYDFFKKKSFKIVGAVTTPLYLDFERGSTNIGDGSLASYMYIDRDAFDSDYYTQMYIKLEGDEASFTDEYDDKLDNASDLMDELASSVSDGRYRAIKAEAEEKLADGKQEYQNGLSKYNKAKTSAYSKINSAQKKIDDGSKLLAKQKKTVINQRTQLEKSERLLKNAIIIKELEKLSLKKQLDEGEIDEATYNEKTDEANTIIADSEANIAQVESGLIQIDEGLKEIAKQEKFIVKNQKKLNSEKAKADSEFAKVKSKLDDASQEIRDAEQEIEDLKGGESYSLSRETNMGYATFVENANIVHNIAKIFPLFFFLIAALVCMTTMTRMIDEQRSQIGCFKALGYSNAAILSKYMTYSGSAALFGSLFGFLVGSRIFPAVIWHAYTMMYSFKSNVNFIYNWGLGIACILVSLICCMGATWISCAEDFKVVPAELIRPKSPKAGKRILLERIEPVWSKISFLYKVSLRNIFRYKKRFLLMIIGVSGCTALLIAGLGINTTIKGVVKNQFSEVSHYDYQLSFDQDMSADNQKEFYDYANDNNIEMKDAIFEHTSNVDMIAKNKTYAVNLTASNDKNVTKFHDFHYKGKKVEYPGDGEIIISNKMHHLNGLNIGDKVILKDDYDEMEVVVSGIFENYVWEPVFITETTYEKGFGKKADIKTGLIQAPDGYNATQIRQSATDLSEQKNVIATSINQDMIDRIDNMMESLNAIVYVVIICAGLLAFIVLYNLTNINITERIREIATIKVLGFNQKEVSQYVFRENIFLTMISAVVGIPLGNWLLKFVVDNININMIFFSPRITTLDYVLAVILTFVFAFIVSLVLQGRLRKVSMTESLKSIE